VSDEERNLLALAQVGQPVPGIHALDADHDVVAEGARALRKVSGRAAMFLSKTTVPFWSRTQRWRDLACRSMPQ
jgi:hypothetical protein